MDVNANNTEISETNTQGEPAKEERKITHQRILPLVLPTEGLNYTNRVNGLNKITNDWLAQHLKRNMKIKPISTSKSKKQWINPYFTYTIPNGKVKKIVFKTPTTMNVQTAREALE